MESIKNRQFRVMIIDDEPIIRKALVNIIDWEGMNCAVVCEAEDGVDAVEKLYAMNPDIVITDIKMPEMDGIALAKSVYEKKLPIKVILLTGYADFEYAKKAIEFGVVDFILKPTTTESVVEAVNKAKKLIIEEWETQRRIIEMEERIRVGVLRGIENEIRELSYGIKGSVSELKRLLSQLNIAENEFHTLIFSLEYTGCTDSKNIEDNFDTNKNLMTLKNIISLAFKDSAFFVSSLEADELCLLLLFEESECADTQMTRVLTICKEILEISENFMNYSVAIGISHRHKSFSEMRFSHEEAAASLSQSFYGVHGNAIYTPCAKESHSVDPSIIHSSIDKILSYTQRGECNDALQELDEVFNFAWKNNYPVSETRNIGILLCSALSKHLNKYKLDLSEITGYDSDSLYLYILETKKMTSLIGILSEMLRSAITHLRSSDVQVNPIIIDAQNYLNDNYSRDLSLKDIAAHIPVNSSYLSRLFKKETGETITEALTKIRIEKAKEILVTTDKKSYEIAAMVGIEEPVYFSQLFKKYTGLNPKDFRRQRKRR